jgi:hypothetical protein
MPIQQRGAILNSPAFVAGNFLFSTTLPSGELHECAKVSARDPVGENPIYIKVNRQHRIDYCTTGIDECSKTRRRDMPTQNADEPFDHLINVVNTFFHA